MSVLLPANDKRQCKAFLVLRILKDSFSNNILNYKFILLCDFFTYCNLWSADWGRPMDRTGSTRGVRGLGSAYGSDCGRPVGVSSKVLACGVRGLGLALGVLGLGSVDDP